VNEETTPPGSERASGPLAGERLAAARRDQELSIREIAKELHLDEVKVQALEQNKFEVLGAPVFAKGHLRKYAELVGVPVDDVLADYYSLNRSAGPPPVIGTPRKARADIDLSRYVIPVIVLLLAGGGVAWWIASGSPLPRLDTSSDIPAAGELDLIRRPQEPAASRDQTAAPDTDRAAAGDEAAAPMPDTVPAVETAREEETEPTADAAAADPPPVDAGPSPAGPQVSLAMSFSGDCWTEVTDASGSRLFFDLGRAGRTVNVSGTPPLRVLFGNISNVSLTVDGASFAIPASALRGETARFTINAP
jgi:cytoskeleton protein RodZ